MNATRTLPLAALMSLLALVPLAPPAGAATARARSARPVQKSAATHAVVPFIADDLERALADAKKSNRPLFVESWAPW